MKESPDISIVSILGCGWLGAALARNLLAEGLRVKGSTQHAEKKSVMKDVGIQPYLLRLTPELSQLNPDDFFTTDLLVIAIPSENHQNGRDYHSLQIKAIAREIRKNAISKVIYISSTSVYPDMEKEITEEDAPNPDKSPQPAVREAEIILEGISSNLALDLTILRCGDIVGPKRVPGKYFAGNVAPYISNTPVNYIHRNDVIGVILEVIGQHYWNQTLNVVAPLHPSRKEVYTRNAADFGFEVPAFKEESIKSNKIISPKKLQDEFGYKFMYPDPLQFRYQ